MVDNQSQTLDYATPRPRSRRPIPVGALLCAASAIGTLDVLLETYLAYRMNDRPLGAFPLYLSALVITACWSQSVERCEKLLALLQPCNSKMPRKFSYITRGFVVLMVVIASSAITSVDSCPHATYLRVGPITITLAGKQCGNQRRAGSFFWQAIDRFLWR